MDEVLAPEVMAARRPMIEAAVAGERQWFAADYDHPERGPLALQSEYMPQTDARGRVLGVIMIIHDVTEQRPPSARSGERGALPADRRIRHL